VTDTQFPASTNGGQDPLELAAVALEQQAEALRVQSETLRAQASALRAVRTSAQSSSTPTPLVDKRELARLLRVSPATVDRLDRDGQPFVRVGDAKRYSPDDVLTWHRKRTSSEPAVEPQSEPGGRDSGVRRLSGRRRGQRGEGCI
jgi:hypothetical protein